jgi:uncharacterized membrane protein YkvA (DUF1232 family)
MQKLSLFARLRRLPRYLRDRKVSFGKKMLVVLGAAYLISPVDLLPELFVPVIGWLDDLGLLTALTIWMYNELGNWWEERVE